MFTSLDEKLLGAILPYTKYTSGIDVLDLICRRHAVETSTSIVMNVVDY